MAKASKKFSNNNNQYAEKAFVFLKVAFVVAPIVAGLDKFFYMLTNWSKYACPLLMNVVDDHIRGFMMLVGIIEIIAGIGVFFKPKLFSYIVALWLVLIIINLLLTGHYFDIALRDFGLLLGALALGSLSQKYAK
jgi:hypothetical protein